MESWYNRRVHPRQRVERHLAFEDYLLNEVFPLVNTQAPDRYDKRIAVTGCSLGAFHAALLAFRHPWLVSRMIALSGKYENSTFLHGYSDTETFLTNPLAFLPGLHDPHYVYAMRAMDIVIVAGDADPHVKEDYELAHILGTKGIPHTLDVWEGWAHDWPYWHAMILKYL
jgi:esterase/lipase superfamily enzyme